MRGKAARDPRRERARARDGIAAITPPRALVVLRFLLNTTEETDRIWTNHTTPCYLTNYSRSAETGEIFGLGKGTPQGAPISPLLANLYMRRFILGWKHLGYERWLQAYIVNYADDFVIVCRQRAEEAYTAMAKLMSVLKLEINRDKTRICRLPADTFDFLGYTFGRCYSTRTGKVYLGTRPSKKKVAAIMDKISHLTNRQSRHHETAVKVEELNALMRGWGNYFCLGPVSKAYRADPQIVGPVLIGPIDRPHHIHSLLNGYASGSSCNKH